MTTDTAAPTGRPGAARWAGFLSLGFGTNFLDTLGIGSFATTTAILRLFHLIDDQDIPGTLNVGHSIPTLFECVLFIIALGGLIDLKTIVSMVLAAGIGAWFGAGIVVRLPRRVIQRAMALALVVTAGFMTLRLLTDLSLQEGTIGFAGAALVAAVAVSLVLGALTSLGIGNYAPTMAFTYMLGMNQKAVFPIMASSAALILPVAALRFFRSGRFDRQISKGLALGGVPGVLFAVYVVKELPLREVKWIVVMVLLYTAVTLYRASLAKEEPAP